MTPTPSLCPYCPDSDLCEDAWSDQHIHCESCGSRASLVGDGWYWIAGAVVQQAIEQIAADGGRPGTPEGDL